MSGSSLPARNGMEAWSDLYAQRVEKVSVAPAASESLDAALRIGALGPIRIVQLRCGCCTIDRAAQHIAQASGRVYNFILQARGIGVFTQYGHEAALGTGDLTLSHG
ncbi:MAG: hypothetical protein ACREUG_01450, partial [Steroidobacteraceae bacterium]